LINSHNHFVIETLLFKLILSGIYIVFLRNEQKEKKKFMKASVRGEGRMKKEPFLCEGGLQHNGMGATPPFTSWGGGWWRCRTSE
jgi:hypothetical protein